MPGVQRHRRERPHAADRVVKELLLRERVDDAARDAPVALPVIEKHVARNRDRARRSGHCDLQDAVAGTSATAGSVTFAHPG